MEQRKKSPAVKTVILERKYVLAPKTCAQCGKAFVGVKIARYCSRACTRAASYYRHAEERRKHRREVYKAAQKKG
jgi:ferredoxin